MFRFTSSTYYAVTTRLWDYSNWYLQCREDGNYGVHLCCAIPTVAAAAVLQLNSRNTCLWFLFVLFSPSNLSDWRSKLYIRYLLYSKYNENTLAISREYISQKVRCLSSRSWRLVVYRRQGWNGVTNIPPPFPPPLAEYITNHLMATWRPQLSIDISAESVLKKELAK